MASKNSPTIMPEHIGQAEFKRNDWVADIPLTVRLEDVLEPSYWSHVALQMQPLDHIEVRAEDGSWIAYLIVSFCERNYARVVLDRVVKLKAETDAPIDSIKHKVEWKGPVHKWSVIRVSDSNLLHDGETSRYQATAWLQEHEKTAGI